MCVVVITTSVISKIFEHSTNFFHKPPNENRTICFLIIYIYKYLTILRGFVIKYRKLIWKTKRNEKEGGRKTAETRTPIYNFEPLFETQ